MRELKLTLSVSDISVVKWWVDTLYAIHEGFQGNTGAMMSLGKEVVSIFSTKQKINRKISTEGEMVVVDNYVSKILWSRYCIEA